MHYFEGHIGKGENIFIVENSPQEVNCMSDRGEGVYGVFMYGRSLITIGVFNLGFYIAGALMCHNLDRRYGQVI